MYKTHLIRCSRGDVAACAVRDPARAYVRDIAAHVAAQKHHLGWRKIQRSTSECAAAHVADATGQSLCCVPWNHNVIGGRWRVLVQTQHF